jgi:hypothetical protein
VSEHPKCFAETLLLNSKDPICNPNSQNINRENESVTKKNLEAEKRPKKNPREQQRTERQKSKEKKP